MNLDILLTLLDKPIVFHRPFLRVMNTNCALFLSQCLHWQRHTKYDGWFAHTIEQFEFETGLSTDEQRSIKKTLKNKGILKIERRGNPCKNWYTIDLEVLYTLLEKQVEKSTNKKWENPTSSNGKIPHQEVGKSHNYINKEVIINSNDEYKKNINTKKSFLNLNIVGITDCDNVQLEQKQYEKLISDYNTQTVHTQIMQLDGYLEDHPKKYKSHYKALRSWLLKATKENGKPKYETVAEHNERLMQQQLSNALVEGNGVINPNDFKPF
jgi:hypothetical protein